MTFDGRTATSLVMFLLFLGACLMAMGLPTKAAFMPLLIGIPGTLMCAAQLMLDLRGEREPPKPVEKANADSRSEVEVFVWLGLFAVVLLTLGFLIGAPLIVIAFVRFSSREPWTSALFAGIGTFVVLYGVFTLLLEQSLFEGLILEMLL